MVKLKSFALQVLMGLVLGTLSWQSVAASQRCRLLREQGSVAVIPDLPETFWQPTGAIRKVRDGLALTVERKVELLDRNAKVVGEASGRCRLVYDIWAETFLLLDSSYSPPREFKFASQRSTEALQRCAALELPKLDFSSLHVTALVNPVDAKQEERTRNWLATKGIGGSGAGVVGRALGAVINLKTESTVDYDCTP